MSVRQLCPPLILLFSLCVGPFAHAAPSTIVRYPRPIATIDPHGEYVHEILQQALKNSKDKYQLVPSAISMPQIRAIQEVAASSGVVDLIWTMSTDEREAQMIPVRIPIDKGLIGWRIPFVTNDKRDIFKNIASLTELAAFSAGQGHDWPDTPILKHNGLRVHTSTSYESLFSMLEAGRFDYFPRSIFEIWKEFESHQGKNLHIEENIILHYQSAYYFFVSPRRPKLAEDLRLGLEEMIANGNFEKIFQKHHQASLKNANIKQRTVIELHNPLLNPGRLPLNRDELWYRP